MTEPNSDMEADTAAQQKVRLIVGRAVLKQLRNIVTQWEDEERADQRRVLWILLCFGLIVFFVALFPFFAVGHPKSRLFAMAIGAGLVLAVGMIIWSRGRQTENRSSRFEKDKRRDEVDSST
jgi:Flp pilus assembly protein TadB